MNNEYLPSFHLFQYLVINNQLFNCIGLSSLKTKQNPIKTTLCGQTHNGDNLPREGGDCVDRESRGWRERVSELSVSTQPSLGTEHCT